MLKSHRNILLKNRVDLVRDIEPNDLTNYLYQGDILSDNDVDLVKAERTRKSRAELFLNMIPRKGPNAFNALIKSLQQERGTEHLAQLLLSESDSDVQDAIDADPKLSKPRHVETYATENIESYRMIHKPRGLCLIINNRYFKGLPTRYGSDADAENLQELFSSLNFTVKRVHDATVEMMTREIQKASEMDHSASDCLIVCLLSHGISGKIYDIDGQLIQVSQLLQPLLICDKNPTLAGKPKLFFIQACRVSEDLIKLDDENGTQKSSAKSFDVEVHQDSIKPNKEFSLSSELFVQEATTALPAHVIMSYSTVPGEASWRNSSTGSWFIKELVDVFKVHAAKEDVLSMLTKVNQAVSTRISSNTTIKQMPSLINTLTKKLYLPGK